MTIAIPCIDRMSDRDLLDHVKRAAQRERETSVQLIALLMELDARKLYLAEGCSSLFTYCRQVLHLSEHAAYGRIEAARTARRYPVILERLAEGTLHLTAIGLLGPHLTRENHLQVLEAAAHKSKREIEALVARLCPRPDVPATVRKLPERGTALAPGELKTGGPNESEAALPSAANAPLTPSRPASVTPLAPERYKIQFTVSRETHDRLRRAQDLMRHTIPDGDPGAIFERALALLVGELERTKLAATDRPRTDQTHASRSRNIPAAVKRAVWQRDGGRCAFKGAQGRCTETGFLEFHHVVPYAAGGETSVKNLELRCGLCRYRHNRHYADWRIMPRSPDSDASRARAARVSTRHNSEAAEIREQGIAGTKAATSDPGRCGSRQRAFLHLQVRVDVDLRCGDGLVSEVEGDDRRVVARAQELHRRRVAQDVRRHPLVSQRGTGRPSGHRVFVHEPFDRVATERAAPTAREKVLVGARLPFTQPVPQRGHGAGEWACTVPCVPSRGSGHARQR